MRAEQALAKVKFRHRGRTVRLKALVDARASKSVIFKHLADELGSFIPLDRPYELRMADREGRLKITGQCLAEVIFERIQVPGRAVSEVAENPREGVDLIMGRPEIDAWDIIFTPEGPRPRKVPIEFEVL